MTGALRLDALCINKKKIQQKGDAYWLSAWGLMPDVVAQMDVLGTILQETMYTCNAVVFFIQHV